MDATELLAIARHWSFWDAPPPETIRRRLPLPQELRPDVALVIQGVRRSGKSTLMTQLPDHYGLAHDRCLTINFEDPRLANSLDHTTLQRLVEAFEREHGPGTTYFLDEIQHVAGWQQWLRMQLDRPADRRFVVTGSNAHLLSGEFASSLTGRHLTLEVFPFDLEEFRSALPEATILEFLTTGGFPATVGTGDADDLLRAYLADIVERDVRERVHARSSRPLRQLTQMIFESAGSESSTRRLAAALGMASETTACYLDAMADAYLAFACPYFAWSERKRASRNRKYYPIDTGLRRIAVTRTGRDRGKMLECATFLQLRRHFGEVFYWRDRGEVDFVVLRDGEPVPIQVSWDQPTERHHKGLDDFHSNFPRAHEAYPVTAETFDAGLPGLLPT